MSGDTIQVIYIRGNHLAAGLVELPLQKNRTRGQNHSHSRRLVFYLGTLQWRIKGGSSQDAREPPPRSVNWGSLGTF